MNKYLLSVALISVITSGCAPTIVGGGATVITSAAEERGVSGVYDDAKIKTQIVWKLSQAGSAKFGHVDVVVRQGKVLLTGTVKNPEDKIDAVNMAWKVKGVREVVDEISSTHQVTLSNYAKDSWITTKVKSTLLFDDKVSSINYNVQTINGVVYLMGIAPSQQDLETALNRISQISGVSEVVNHATVNHKKES